MKVAEFINVLKEFPQDAELEFGNSCAETGDDFLLGISAESENDPELPQYNYNNVTLCIINGNDTHYDVLIDEEYKLYGNNKVWYNTIDTVHTYKRTNGKLEKVELIFDEGSHTFQEKIIF